MRNVTKNIIKKLVPRPIRLIGRYVIYFPVDIINSLLGRKDPLVLPVRLIGYKASLAFKKDGEEFFRYYIELCRLKPGAKVLDVGCGVARKAIPLIKYLDGTGRYEGFDIIKTEIDWCKKRISTKYPNFNFQQVDIFNKCYNPRGRYRASEFRFPFEDECFDFVVLGSVFTHMLPEGVENYLSEISRVLKKGGKSLITFFLLNKESLELINAQKSTLDFAYEYGRYRTINPDMPEDAVCYDEPYILSLYEKCGLKIEELIHYGAWCGRQDFLSHQDIIIATKTQNGQSQLS